MALCMCFFGQARVCLHVTKLNRSPFSDQYYFVIECNCIETLNFCPLIRLNGLQIRPIWRLINEPKLRIQYNITSVMISGEIWD